MFRFLFKLWDLARAYRFRLVLGMIATILNGLADPIVIFVTAIVFTVVLPTEHSETLDALIKKNDTLRYLINHAHQTASGDLSTPALLAVVSLIPLAMLIRGILGYLSSY